MKQYYKVSGKENVILQNVHKIDKYMACYFSVKFYINKKFV